MHKYIYVYKNRYIKDIKLVNLPVSLHSFLFTFWIVVVNARLV